MSGEGPLQSHHHQLRRVAWDHTLLITISVTYVQQMVVFGNLHAKAAKIYASLFRIRKYSIQTVTKSSGQRARKRRIPLSDGIRKVPNNARPSSYGGTIRVKLHT